MQSQVRNVGLAADFAVDKELLEIVYRPDGLVIKGQQHVSDFQAGSIRRTFLLNRMNEHARRLFQSVIPDHTGMQGNLLASDSEITAPDSSVFDQPRGHKIGGFAPNGETDSLGHADDRRVDADDFPAGIDQRTARVARIKRSIGLDDVVNEASGGRRESP